MISTYKREAFGNLWNVKFRPSTSVEGLSIIKSFLQQSRSLLSDVHCSRSLGFFSHLFR